VAPWGLCESPYWHAEIQKENVDAYENRLDTLASRSRAVAAELGRVRQPYAAYAARDREQASTDPAACQRLADRSAVLAAMAARSRELLERGRLVLSDETTKCSFCSTP